MAAASALQSAMKEFSEPPKIPTLALAEISEAPKSAQAEKRKRLISDIDEFHAFVAKRLERTRVLRDTMAVQYDPARNLDPISAKENLAGLDRLIALIDSQIADSRKTIESHAKMHRTAIRGITSRFPTEARFVQAQVQKLSQAATLSHNDLVDYHSFLLSLRTDFDENSRGGSQFENAADLDVVTDKPLDLPPPQSEPTGFDILPGSTPMRYSLVVHGRFVAAVYMFVLGILFSITALVMGAKVIGIIAALTLLAAGVLSSAWLGQASYERSNAS